MKLRKENRNSLHVLAIEGSLSTRDCTVLLAGIRKLFESPSDWVLDMTLAEPEPDCRDVLDALLLDATGHCPGEFWIAGPHPWAHVARLEDVIELRTRAPLATACLETWFEKRASEIRAKTTVLSETIRNTTSPEMLDLRRENSRLKRRLAKVEAETAAIESNSKTPASLDAGAAAIRERIISSMDHAVYPRERA